MMLTPCRAQRIKKNDIKHKREKRPVGQQRTTEEIPTIGYANGLQGAVNVHLVFVVCLIGIPPTGHKSCFTVVRTRHCAQHTLFYRP